MTSTKRAAVSFGVVLFLVLCQSTRAEMKVGDQPKLDFKAVDGTPVSLDRLKGKIVVVDFWATWCVPCMNEAGHMVELNTKYASQGMQLVGISLDSDKAAMKSTAAQKGFVWPQYFDGAGWQNKYAVAWGVHGIPQTYIIGPEGKVLWEGHPGNIDQPLAQAFKEHPPVLVDPKVLADAKAIVASAQSAIKAGDTKAALAAMAKIPAAAQADKEFAAQAKTVQSELEEAGTKMLAEADPLIAAKQYGQAVTKLKQLSAGLSGLPAGTAAQKKLADLLAKPEVKSALAKAARAETAQNLMDAAQKLKTAKKDDQAYLQFKTVATDYADTDAGTKAADIVKDYEKDADFIKHVNETEGAGKATSTLKIARSYAEAGRNDLARRKYQEVIDNYPGTSFAATAKKALAALPE